MTFHLKKYFLLVFFFTLGAVIFGVQVALSFTEPSAAPPGSNVPAPLNVSSAGQSKSGGLILNTGGAANGLIVAGGNVGIGTTGPSTNLHVLNTTTVSPRNILNEQVNSGADGPQLNFRKARGSPGALSAILSGDILMAIWPAGYDGSAYGTGAGLRAIAAENWSTAAHGTYLEFSSTPVGSIAVSEKMRIDPAGNVGIGTTGPGSKLDVAGIAAQSSDGIVVRSTDGRSMLLGPSRGAGGSNPLTQAGDLSIIYSAGSIDTGALVIGQWSSSARGMRIDSSGNVGIGGNLTVAGQSVCRADGTNCPAGSGSWTRSGTNTYLTNAGDNVGIGATPSQKLDVAGITKTQKLQLGGKWLLSGIGDADADDDWLRVFNAAGTGYYGGIAMAKLWVGNDAYVGGNLTYGGTLSELDVADNFTATVRAADFNLGHSGRRGTPGRALVDLGSTGLQLNYGPDWTNTIIGGNVGIGTTGPGAKLDVNGGIRFDRGSFGNTPTVSENDWLRDAWLTAQGGTNLRWDDTTKTWKRGGSDDPATCYGYNDFGGILHDSNRLNFIKGACGLTKEWTNTDFRNQFTKMSILSDGNVGIGTVSPGAKLEIGNTAGPLLVQKWYGSGGRPYGIENYDNHLILADLGVRRVLDYDPAGSISLGAPVGIAPQDGVNEGGQVTFSGAGSNRYFYIDNVGGTLRLVTQDAAGESVKFVIGNDGAVGIGTPAPGAKLEVAGGAIKATGGLIIETRTSDPASPVAGQMWLRTDL